MSDLNLSDFWKARHDGGIRSGRFFKEARKLSKQPWQHFSPNDILSILSTCGEFLKAAKEEDQEQYLKAKEVAWLPIEGKCLNSVRRRSNEFGRDLNLLIPCLNRLADPSLNIDVTQRSIDKINRNIPTKNFGLFKKAISDLLSYVENRIEHFSGVQLHNFAVAMINLKPRLIYLDEIPKEDLMHKFFDQTAKAMITPDLGFQPLHFNIIARMCDEMFIIPPDRFIRAAKEWHKKQPQSKELDAAIEKFGRLGKLAFEAYRHRPTPKASHAPK